MNADVFVRLAPAALCLACAPLAVCAQGYAGLGSAAEGDFAVPEQGYELSFPQDHYPHPAFRIEWWYLTATLEDADGNPYGAQWTLFRSALAPEASSEWDARQIWMGHAAVTLPDEHRYAERLARGGIGQAGVDQPFEAFIDDWAMRSTASEDADPLSAMIVTARGGDFAYEFDLTADGPLVFHGDAGYSVKSSEGQASHYYSQPFYSVDGTISLPEGDIDVTGSAWLDREWSSQPLSSNQTGWDWFSLSFEGGAKLMAFGLRADNGEHFTSATWIDPDGTTTAYGDQAILLEPLERSDVAEREIPTRWRLTLPAEDLDITTDAVFAGAWMGTSFPYWEGPVSVSGSHSGRGYLEMTGYE